MYKICWIWTTTAIIVCATRVYLLRTLWVRYLHEQFFIFKLFMRVCAPISMFRTICARSLHSLLYLFIAILVLLYFCKLFAFLFVFGILHADHIRCELCRNDITFNWVLFEFRQLLGSILNPCADLTWLQMCNRQFTSASASLCSSIRCNGVFSPRMDDFLFSVISATMWS